jgi:hypothetical protein
MALSGSDDQGAYIDTGCNTTPTTRAATHVDFHTLTGVTESDPDRADKTLKVPAPRRPVGQRR